jgi:hypothetical protein
VLEVSGCEPRRFGYACGLRVAQQRVVLTTFSSCLSVVVTNMQIVRPLEASSIGFEQLVAATSRMSIADLFKLKGTIEEKAKRTPEEARIMAMFGSLLKVRTERTSPLSDALTWSAQSPPLPLVPWACLLNLHQTGTRMDPRNTEGYTYTLAQLFMDPSLLSEYTVILMGPNCTSGFGKTEFAKRLAAHWSLLLCNAMQRPSSSARVVFTTTLESAKEVTFQKGDAWVLDEFSPHDRDAVQYASEAMLKTLFSPVSSGNLRARNSNVNLPAGVARIITCNACSPQQWVGKGILWSEPLKRKSILFQLSLPLVVANWSKVPEFMNVGAEAASASLPLERARELLLASPPPLPLASLVPPPPVDRSALAQFLCPTRR